MGSFIVSHIHESKKSWPAYVSERTKVALDSGKTQANRAITEVNRAAKIAMLSRYLRGEEERALDWLGCAV